MAAAPIQLQQAKRTPRPKRCTGCWSPVGDEPSCGAVFRCLSGTPVLRRSNLQRLSDRNTLRDSAENAKGLPTRLHMREKVLHHPDFRLRFHRFDGDLAPVRMNPN